MRVWFLSALTRPLFSRLKSPFLDFGLPFMGLMARPWYNPNLFLQTKNFFLPSFLILLQILKVTNQEVKMFLVPSDIFGLWSSMGLFFHLTSSVMTVYCCMRLSLVGGGLDVCVTVLVSTGIGYLVLASFLRFWYAGIIQGPQGPFCSGSSTFPSFRRSCCSLGTNFWHSLARCPNCPHK